MSCRSGRRTCSSSRTARARWRPPSPATPLIVGAKGNRYDLVLKSLYFDTAYAEQVTMADDVHHILFCLSCKGTSASSDYYFASKVEAGVIRVETEDQAPQDMEFTEEHLVVNEHFNTQYILTFLKAMDHKMITLRLSSAKPLICLYGLGAEESFAMFILGGKTEDTD